MWGSKRRMCLHYRQQRTVQNQTLYCPFHFFNSKNAILELLYDDNLRARWAAAARACSEEPVWRGCGSSVLAFVSCMKRGGQWAVVLGQVRFAEPGGSLNVDLLTSKGVQVQGTVRESLAAARE